MRHTFLFVCICLFLCINASSASELDFRSLGPHWIEALEKLPSPGIAIVVVHNDRVIYEKGLGYRDLANRQPFTTETVSYIASSTKSFVAMGIMILVQQGKLDLDQSVQKYLPYFRIKDPVLSSKITVRDLLTHKYGLDNEFITFAEAYTGEMDEEKFKRLLPETEAEGEFGYNNLHYAIVGRIIEAVSGKNWKEFVKTEILIPAQMRNTFCNASEMNASSQWAIPMRFEDGSLKPETTRKTDRTMHSAGGMAATIRDLARWLRLNLNGGSINDTRILRQDLIQKMQTKQVDVNRTWYEFGREGYGLGWYTGSYRGHLLIHHFGGFSGYRSHISFMPDEKIGVAVLINQAGGYFVDMVACEIYDRFLKLPSKDLLTDLLKKKAQRENILKEFSSCSLLNCKQKCDPPMEINGLYESDNWGKLTIRAVESSTQASIGYLPIGMLFIQRGRFITELPDGPAIGRFIRDDDGKITGVVLSAEDIKMEFKRK